MYFPIISPIRQRYVYSALKFLPSTHKHSTLILSVLYLSSGPFSRVPFFCFRIFTSVKLGTPRTAPSSSFPRTVLHPLFFYLTFNFSPALNCSSCLHKTKTEKRKKDSFHGRLSSQPHFAMAFISVSLESLSMCLHPPPFLHLQNLRRPAPESLGLHLIGILPASQPLPHHLPIWPRCSQLKHLLSPRELIPCSSASMFLQSWSFSGSNSCLLNC